MDNKVLTLKMKLAAPLVVALTLGSVEANAGMILGADLTKLTVFSNTYTTTGANSIVHGSMLVGTIATTGANAAVNGDITSVGAANIGGGTATVTNTALVTGNVISNGVLTIGGATGGIVPGPNVTGSIISTGASTIGAYAKVGGDMLSGGVATTGAYSEVGTGLNGGNVLSTGAATTGANSKVNGSVISTGVATTGANSIVTGDLRSTAAVSQGATSTVGGTVLASTAVSTTPDLSAVRTTVTTEANQVTTAKAALTAMGVPIGATTALSTFSTFDSLSDMSGHTTLFAGIYSANYLTTTASTILTLDGQNKDNQSWIFNINQYLSTGANTTIKVINAGANASVYWNTGQYTSLGANSTFYGTVLAKTYVSVGASAQVHDIGTSCGAVYSETSYVSTGDGAIIGGNGCSATVVSIPEPESFGMLLAALAFFGFKRSRKA